MVARVIALSDERDTWLRWVLAAWRDGYAAGRDSMDDAVTTAYIDGLLRRKGIEHEHIRALTGGTCRVDLWQDQQRRTWGRAAGSTSPTRSSATTRAARSPGTEDSMADLGWPASYDDDGNPLHARRSAPGEPRTDLGYARRLVRVFGGRLRYVPAWHRWLTWDDTRWPPDATGQPARWMKSVARLVTAAAMAIEDAETSSTQFAARRGESSHAIAGALALASTEAGWRSPRRARRRPVPAQLRQRHPGPAHRDAEAP